MAGTLVLLAYFGPDTGPRVLSVVWLLVTLAAAGMIADHTGSFAPIFRIFAVMLLMREPVYRGSVAPIVG